MGQDVMQVAGDAGALLEHGPVGQLLAGRLQGGRLLLEGAGVAAPGGQHHPQHPAADEHDGHIADLQQVDVPDAGGRGGQHLERAQQGQGAPPQGPGGGADRDHGGQGGERLQQVGRVLERGPGRVGDAEAGHHQQRRPAQGQQGQDVGGQQGPARRAAGRRWRRPSRRGRPRRGPRSARRRRPAHDRDAPWAHATGYGRRRRRPPGRPAPTPEVVGGRTRPPAAAEVLLAVHSPSCRRTPADP
jgi:hypothetical protein